MTLKFENNFTKISQLYVLWEMMCQHKYVYAYGLYPRVHMHHSLSHRRDLIDKLGKN